MGYTEGFTSVRNAFLVSDEYSLDEKYVLIWLASKPPDWDVKLEIVVAELGIGWDQAKHILRDLRAKGAITKPPPERLPNGQWARPSGRLAPAVRDVIRHVSAGRTESGFSHLRSDQAQYVSAGRTGGVETTPLVSTRLVSTPINKEVNTKDREQSNDEPWACPECGSGACWPNQCSNKSD